jgi:hypothetical protein
MSSRSIHPRIVRKIRQNNAGDKVIGDFLIDLIYEEADHSPGWWWRKFYIQKVEQYSQKWRNKSED